MLLTCCQLSVSTTSEMSAPMKSIDYLDRQTLYLRRMRFCALEQDLRANKLGEYFASATVVMSIVFLYYFCSAFIKLS